jgi:hypothetical protein
MPSITFKIPESKPKAEESIKPEVENFEMGVKSKMNGEFDKAIEYFNNALASPNPEIESPKNIF